MGASKLELDAHGIKAALQACIDFPIKTWLRSGEFASIKAAQTATEFADNFPLELFMNPNAGSSVGLQAGRNSGNSTRQIMGHTVKGSQLDMAANTARRSVVKKGLTKAGSAIQGSNTHMSTYIAPALVAADFFWERSYEFGFKDLYGLVSNGGGASELFPCTCSKSKQAHPEAFYRLNKIKKETECDDAIEWIAFRKYSDSALKTGVGVGAALTVAFAPAGLALTLAVGTAGALQQGYRAVRERYKRNQGTGKQKIGRFTDLSDRVALGITDDGEKYLTPGKKAYWISDDDPAAGRCQFEGCPNTMKSKARATFSFSSSSARHHCRVCGKIYCGDHGGAQLPVLGPLSNDLKQNPPIPLFGGLKTERNLVSNQRVCIDCWGAAFSRGAAVQTYIDGPTRAADILVKNATPAAQGVNGCPRAQAALFCLFHGNFKQVLASLVSRDGKEKVVSQAGIGVTKLPF